MEIDNYISEILKEFRMNVEGLNFPIKAKLLVNYKTKGTIRNYSWEISHYCKGTESAAGPYRPSNIFDTPEQAESMMLVYMETFTTIGVVENENY